MGIGSELRELYVIGAGGFGREVAWLVERINKVNPTWDLRGFIDDDTDICGQERDGYPVLGDCSYLKKIERDFGVVCAVGTAKSRRQIIEKISKYKHIRYAVLIDPEATISERTTIGEGTIICAGNIITVDGNIGRHCIINLDCTVGHDAILEDYVTLYPSVNVSGAVRIGECCEIGTGAHMIQGIQVGSESIIGAGAVVIRDIEPKVTVVGNPAKVVKIHSGSCGGGTEQGS